MNDSESIINHQSINQNHPIIVDRCVMSSDVPGRKIETECVTATNFDGRQYYIQRRITENVVARNKNHNLSKVSESQTIQTIQNPQNSNWR